MGVPIKCPETGEFRAWKQCRVRSDRRAVRTSDLVIVELLVPANATRRQALAYKGWGPTRVPSKKLRVSRAKVVAIYTVDRVGWSGSTEIYGKTLTKRRVAYSHYQVGFRYVVGEVVKPERPFDRGVKRCASGIHCYMNWQHAAAHRG